MSAAHTRVVTLKDVPQCPPPGKPWSREGPVLHQPVGTRLTLSPSPSVTATPHPTVLGSRAQVEGPGTHVRMSLSP